jgi:alpha-beta hydrolase superfamily lysophospholipase
VSVRDCEPTKPRGGAAGHGTGSTPLDSFRATLCDALHVAQHVVARFPDAPLVLSGYSLGGQLALRIASSLQHTARLRGVVCVAPLVKDSVRVSPMVTASLKAVAQVAPWIRLPTPSGGRAYNPLVEASELIQERSDPLVNSGWVRVDTLAAVVESMSEPITPCDVPLLVMHGDCDRICAIRASEQLADDWPGALVRYPRGHHDLLREHHVTRTAALKDLHDWVNQRILSDT